MSIQQDVDTLQRVLDDMADPHALQAFSNVRRALARWPEMLGAPLDDSCRMPQGVWDGVKPLASTKDGLEMLTRLALDTQKKAYLHKAMQEGLV